jgi:transposase
MDKNELMKLEKSEIIELLLAIIQQQALKIKELEERLNQNSKNSSKPPSSDGLKKTTKSLRKPSDKKAGAQLGHDGNGLKLMNEPDKYIVYQPNECVECPMSSTCEACGVVRETRFEIDIEIQTITTAHQIMALKCPMTLGLLTGSFPANITGTTQYGVNLKTLAISLTTMGMVSFNRTHEILSGVFGIPISVGTISSMVTDCAAKVAGPVNEIKEAIKEKPLIHSDETGTRVDKKNVWAHTASTDDLTYIEIQPKRGQEGINAIGILLVFIGTVVHDCLASYFKYETIRHSLCNAHLLRELIAVKENTKQVWAQAMIDLLLEMKDVKEKLLLRNVINPSVYYLRKFNHVYDRLTTEALALNPVPEREKTKKGKPKRGKTGSLVDRLILHKDKYLLFFNDFSVPFDNNQAERDIRMFKVKQKVSGCFRTMDGAKDFAAIMSFIGTARKRGIPAFKAIKDALLDNPFSVKPTA